jgi:hypothetical protein
MACRLCRPKKEYVAWSVTRAVVYVCGGAPVAVVVGAAEAEAGGCGGGWTGCWS